MSRISIGKIAHIWLTSLKQNPGKILYGLVVLGLVIVSICNAYYLISNYVYDNVSTAVKLKSDDDSLGFLEDVSIFLRNERSIFPELWHLDHKNWLDEQAAIMKNATNFDESFFLDSSNASILSLQGKYRISYMLGEIWWADHNAAYYTFADTPRTYPHKAMKRFMGLPQVEKLIAMLENDLLSYAYQRIDLPPAQQTANQSPYFSADLIHTHQLTFHIPIPLHMNKTYNRVRYKIGGSPALAHTMAQNVTARNKTLKASPDFSYTMEAYGTKSQALNKIFGPYNADMNTSVDVIVHILNMNVFDTRYARGEEACARCGTQQEGVEDCIILCKARAFVDTCNCVPFNARKFVSRDTTAKLTYCTWQDYANCFNKTSYQTLTGHCTPKDYVPCEVVTNNYIAQVTTTESKDPFFDLRFWVDQTAYVVFKGKKKNSFLEMLGQLGGNLGLFLSFSLLGIWQFMYFVYRMHKRDRLPHFLKRHKSSSSLYLHSLWLQWMSTNWINAAGENQGENTTTATTCPGNKCACEDKIATLSEDNEKLRCMLEEHVKKETDTEKKLQHYIATLVDARLMRYKYEMSDHGTVQMHM